MNAAPGQAPRGRLRRILLWVGIVLAIPLLAATVAVAALDARLSHGPIPVTNVANWLAGSAAGKGMKPRIATATLGWSHVQRRGGTRLALQLNGITVTDGLGEPLGEAPRATISFRQRAVLGFAPFQVDAPILHVPGANAAIGLHATLRLGLGFALHRTDAAVTVGPGTVTAAGATEAIIGAAFAVHATPAQAVLEAGRIALAPAGQSQPNLALTGSFTKAGAWAGTLVLTGDTVAAADLPTYWPPGFAANARKWVTTHITTGTAYGARFTFAVTASKNLATFNVSGVNGGFHARDLTLNAIKGATPLTRIAGTLTLPDLDTVLIAVPSARLGGLDVLPSTMRITGISKPDQIGVLDIHVAGTIPQALAVLDGPPFNLSANAPAMMGQATGHLAAEIATRLPLDANLPPGAVTYDVKVRLTDAANPLPDGIPGFSDGDVNLRFTNSRISLAGTGKFGGAPVKLAASAATEDPAATFSFGIKTVLTPAFLTQTGLAAKTPISDLSTGGVPVALTVTPLPNRRQKLVLTADLTGATLGLAPFGWAKSAGTPGALSLTASFAGGTLVSIDTLDATAPALTIHGRSSGGTLALNQIAIGRTSAEGSITPPAAGGAWKIAAHGPLLDLRAILNSDEAAKTKPAPPPAGPPTGPAWSATLAFATLNLAAPPAPALQGFSFTGTGKGAAILTAAATAADSTAQPVNVTIAPESDTRRRFAITAGDGGNLLRTLNAFDGIDGGALSITGTYGSGDALIGTLQAHDLRILSVPHSLKVLQALSIYGAAAAARPGLAITQLTAPFSVAKDTLTLSGARAQATSLGFTASGTVALETGIADIDATIIPAYGINSLPGKIPIIGKLFSAEKGGGLFSIRAKITGPLGNPKVETNPVSAATPGAARDAFGVAGQGR